MLARPVLMLLGAAAQVGVFITFLGALALGFPLNEAASIGIIGGAHLEVGNGLEAFPPKSK